MYLNFDQNDSNCHHNDSKFHQNDLTVIKMTLIIIEQRNTNFTKLPSESFRKPITHLPVWTPNYKFG